MKPLLDHKGDVMQAAGQSGGVIGAVLMPHAPILVPPVGGARGEIAAASTQAMRQAAAWLAGLHPETVVLISPHSPRKCGAFGLWVDHDLAGSFASFGAPEIHAEFANDTRLVRAVSVETRKTNVPIWAIRGQSLDYGALVPLWFLAESGWRGNIVVVGQNYPNEGGLVSFGEALAAAAKSVGRRIAFIASGDLSHRLTAEAPSGFHPDAFRFDQALMHLLQAGHYRQLPNLDPALRDLADEDAVDSVMIALAASEWNAAGHEVLSYEGPYGVGYGVAILYAAGSQGAAAPQCSGECLPGLARQSVEAVLGNGPEVPPVVAGQYLEQTRGVFVTIREHSGILRGCIGTLAPSCGNVLEETWRNARLAALHDVRFKPVQLGELPELCFEVSVLHPPESVMTSSQLDPVRFGVILSTRDGRCGLLLPRVEGVNSIEDQLSIARRKGRIDPVETVKLQRFEVDFFKEG